MEDNRFQFFQSAGAHKIYVFDTKTGAVRAIHILTKDGIMTNYEKVDVPAMEDKKNKQ